MKNYILALLTSLFLSAMPLQAAYSQGDNPPATCTTFEDIVSPEAIAQIAAARGSIERITDKALVDKYVKSGEDVYGPPPWSFNSILLITPREFYPAYNVVYFNDNCMVGSGKMPIEIVEKFLGRDE